jgi:hypothetical protein
MFPRCAARLPRSIKTSSPPVDEFEPLLPCFFLFTLSRNLFRMSIPTWTRGSRTFKAFLVSFLQISNLLLVFLGLLFGGLKLRFKSIDLLGVRWADYCCRIRDTIRCLLCSTSVVATFERRPFQSNLSVFSPSLKLTNILQNSVCTFIP